MTQDEFDYIEARLVALHYLVLGHVAKDQNDRINYGQQYLDLTAKAEKLSVVVKAELTK